MTDAVVFGAMVSPAVIVTLSVNTKPVGSVT